MPAKVSASAALCTKGMFWALLTTLLWIPSVVTGAAFRPRGTAPYSNTTSITTSNALAPSTVSGSFSTTQPPYPIHASGTGVSSELVHSGPTGGSPRPIKPSGSINSTNVTSTGSSCTVNIPNANLEWWYAATYDYYLGTFTATAPNWTNEDNIHLTMIPNSEPFDLSSTISNDVAYTETPVYDPIFDEYFTQYAEYLVIPTAAATSVITRNAASPLPSGNVILAPERTLYMNTNPLAPASVTIASTANSTSAITSATPFVYFTAYEVESVANGSTMTETISLRQPAAFEYPVKGIESSVSASGTLPDEVLQRLPQSTCSPGTVQGPVTVLIVLDLFWFYFPKPVPFIVHFESSVLGFESEPVVVAQDTSKGQPFTINLDPKPTQPGGAKTTAERKPGILQTAPRPVSTAPSGGHNGGSKIPNVPQPTQQTVGTIGTNPVVVGPSSQVIVGTETLKPGGPAVTIGGSSISLAPSATAIVVGGQTSSLPLVADPASPTQTVGTVGGMPVVVLPSSVVVVGTQTLQPGGAVTIGGNPVSLAPSATAIIIGGKTSTLPQVIFPGEAAPTQAPAPPVLTIGSSTLTANAATQFFIGPGQTLTPGGTATVGGTVVSLGPSASFVVIGGTTSVLPGTEPTAEPAIVVGSSTITALPGPPNALNQDTPSNGESGPTFVVSGQTLVPGHEITVDGTTISLAPSGSFVVINGVTSTLATAPAAQITPPPLTIGNGVFSALPGTGTTYVIDSATLTPGGVITVDGTTISLAPGATALVVNGVTTTLNPEAQATITNPPLLTIGSHTYTAAPGAGTTFIIDGQTLTPGGTITVDGTTISLAPGATELIYGSGGHSTTSALFPATTTRSQSITGLASAFASAGATGQNGEAVATSSATGAGKSIVAPKTKGCILPLVAGLLGMLLR